VDEFKTSRMRRPIGLVREFAGVTGKSMTAALDGMVQERLEGVRRPKNGGWRSGC
jgi:hypothetical protein